MGRLFELALFGFVIWTWLSSITRYLRSATQPPQSPPPAAPKPAGTTNLIRCAACGVHFPEPDGAGLTAASRGYCSETCRRGGGAGGT